MQPTMNGRPNPRSQGYQTFENEVNPTNNTASTTFCPEEMENLRNNSKQDPDKEPSAEDPSPPNMNTQTAAGSPEPASFNNRYEELMKGSEQCPTCRGLGRIPQHDAEQLVALIPVGDKRLKPRRTAQWVMLSIVVCSIVASLILFFLFPRNVRAMSNQPYLQPIELNINVTNQYVFVSFMNRYNFSNENYVPVSVTGVTMAVQYDMRVLNKVVNTTNLVIPHLSKKEYHVAMNLTLSGDEGYLAKFCNDPRRWVHDMFMQFDLTANYSYLGHIEQTTLTTYQHVSCGNDTKSHSWN